METSYSIHIELRPGRNLAILFTLLLLCVVSTVSIAQYDNIKFDKLLVSDGLVQSSIKDMVRDQYGFLWIATRGGLSRYDGSEFENYFKNSEDSFSLSHSSIWSLKNDDNGDLWIGTSNGLNKYKRSSEQFIPYLHKGLENNVITKIVDWSPDILILGTSKGLFFFDKKREKYVNHPVFNVLDTLLIRDIIKRKDKSLLIATSAGLFSTKGQSVTKVLEGSIFAVFEDDNLNLWVSFMDISFLYSSDFMESKVISNRSFFRGIQSDGNGHIIISNGKVEIFNLDGDLLHNYGYSPFDDYSLLFNSATCIEIDYDGIWWIGVNGYGINRYDPNNPSINILRHQSEKKSTLSSSYVKSFFTEDDTTVFIATSRGLDVFDVELNMVENIYLGTADIIYEESKNIWIPSGDNKLLVIDKKSMTIIKEYIVPDMSTTKAMHIDEKGIIWLGASSGLLKFNPNTGSTKTFLPLSSDIVKSQQFSDWVTAIYDQGDYYILGTSAGMYKFDLSTEIITEYSNTGFKNSFIKCIEEDNNGNLWVGTWGDGVFSWEIATGEIKQFTRNEGLPNDVVYGVLADKEGYLWMSTNYGLSRFNPKDESFFNIDVNYGLQSNEFNTSAYFKSPNDIMYFGGIEGLNYFNPEGIKNKKVPNTYITGAYLGHEKLLAPQLGSNSKSIMELDTIVLNYDQNMIGFDFNSTNLTISNLNQYAYFLDGLETDWNYRVNRRYVDYSSIPPGDYVFKVKSSNNDGVWDESYAQIVVIINPPYWQTLWFKALVLVVIAWLLYAFYAWRTYNLREKQKVLSIRVEEATAEITQQNKELREAQDRLVQSEKMVSLGVLSAGIGHEMNNPLNFIKGGIDSLQKHLKQYPDISDESVPYFNAVNEGVKRSTNIVKSLNHFSRQTTKMDEVCNIHDIANNCLVMLNSKIINRVEVKKSFMSSPPTILGNEGKLHQAIFNLLDNAAQSIIDKGEINIKTELEDDNLILTISDSGEGISEENISKIYDPFFTTKALGKGTGLGLSITYTIIEEHKGNINVSSKPNEGTRFVIRLPYYNS